VVAKQDQQRIVQLSEEPIDLASAYQFLQTPEAGGISIFAGITRRWTNGKETLCLNYTCYETMAQEEMHRLVDLASSKWILHRVCLIHRMGQVPVSEASVVIGVATSHRPEAFEACRFLIDQLKIQVPIWKHETYTDGTASWIEGTHPPEPHVSDDNMVRASII